MNRFSYCKECKRPISSVDEYGNIYVYNTVMQRADRVSEEPVDMSALTEAIQCLKTIRFECKLSLSIEDKIDSILQKCIDF